MTRRFLPEEIADFMKNPGEMIRLRKNNELWEKYFLDHDSNNVSWYFTVISQRQNRIVSAFNLVCLFFAFG